MKWYHIAGFFIKVLSLKHPNTKTVLNNTYSSYIRSGKDKEGFEDWLKRYIDNIIYNDTYIFYLSDSDNKVVDIINEIKADISGNNSYT